MKPGALWQISIVTSLEAEDAVVELLNRVFSKPVTVYTDEETKVTRASVYCPHRSEWMPSRKAALQQGLKMIRAEGLEMGAVKILARKVAREDWAESWKRHFKPIEISPRLLIKPSWIKRRPRKGQAVVVLDPGLSFGTGNHPTTAFCLHELAKSRKEGERQTFWDVGTGSGILAIAAIKLGYRPVEAIDFDPEAIRVTKENARQNGVLRELRISKRDITRLPLHSREKHDFICANLISNLLLTEQRRILSRLKEGGTLVLAGILKKEFSEILKAYKQAGLKLSSSRIEGEWRSGAFILRGE